MGALVSTMWDYWFGGKEFKIVMVGLDNAGKTTILYKLHLGEVVTSQATVGSNVELVKYRNLALQIWDLGGQQNLRPFWASYYKNTDAVILVVDSTDRARVGVTKSELFNLLENEDLARSPILVMANKQDLRDAMGPPRCDGCGGADNISLLAQHTQPRLAHPGMLRVDGGWPT
eukprot:gene31142-6282_t